jgi:predicted MPP superfamily phosphohydrolase
MNYFIMSLSSITALIIIYYLYIAHKNTRQFVINHIEVDRNPNIKGKLHLSVLHISDMHLENISVSPEQIYEQFKDHPIDIIALTGDFLDRKRSIPRLIPYLEVFNRLHPKHGTYAVFGNHDYVLNTKNFESLKEVLEQYGCHTMQNDHKRIDINGTPVNIIGIDDFSTRRSDVAASYTGIDQGYNLVLTHDPNIVLHMKEFDFQYLVSGHFHGGQIHWPKPYHLAKMGKLVKMNMVKGLHSYHGKPFYISEGLGQTGVNIRIGSRPEMTLHQLHLPLASVVPQKTLTAV